MQGACEPALPSLAAVASCYAIYACFAKVEMEMKLSPIKACEPGSGPEEQSQKQGSCSYRCSEPMN